MKVATVLGAVKIEVTVLVVPAWLGFVEVLWAFVEVLWAEVEVLLVEVLFLLEVLSWVEVLVEEVECLLVEAGLVLTCVDLTLVDDCTLVSQLVQVKLISTHHR